MFPTLSILIPAKNEEKTISKCLESFLNSTYPKDKLEIIVNVNGSSDKTFEICKKYKEVKAIETGPKSCRAEALNEIIPKAKGEIIGIFDADSFVEKDCLTQAIERFSDKEVIGVSGLVKSVKDSMIAKAISIEKSAYSFMEYIISKLGSNSYFVGKNMYVRRMVFERTGKLDTNVYLDDFELSIRMKENKFKVVYEPTAVAWEQDPRTLESFYKQRQRWARSAIKVRKLKTERKLREWIADAAHYINYYVPPLSTAALILTGFFLLFNIQLTLLMPFFVLLIGLFLYIAFSKVFFREPVTDLLFLPVWFALSNIYAFVIFPKTYIDEKRNRQFIWHDIERK